MIFYPTTLLKSPTDKYRYFASILSGVIFFVEMIATGIAAILSVLYVDVSNDK